MRYDRFGIGWPGQRRFERAWHHRNTLEVIFFEKKENDEMKKMVLALSLLFLISIIFIGAPTLAQKADKAWEDEEIAPPAPAPPAPAPQTAWGGRWPWTSQRLIQPEELWPLSLRELEIMRNEIYARHGWVFKRPDLRSYFESQPWYRPKGDLSNLEESNRWVEAELTPVERRNIQIIVSRERALRR
jgi:hypothetical protein